jgi:hypothetical protein
MKWALLAFVALLFLAHQAGNADELLAQPLSLFRDGPEGWLGYGLFAVLLLIGSLYTTALARADRVGEAVLSGLAVLLLVAVAATPSWGSGHLVASLVLLLLLYGYYALLLYRAESRCWLLAHLAVPVALALATGFHSYGVWQKGIILYYVLAATLHHHALGQLRVRGSSAASRSGTSLPGCGTKRRKVFRVGPGRAWARGIGQRR